MHPKSVTKSPTPKAPATPATRDWRRKLDPVLREQLDTRPANATFNGLLSATLSEAQLQQQATTFGFTVGTIAGNVATFRGADRRALQALAELAAVEFIEGSRPLGPDDSTAIDD